MVRGAWFSFVAVMEIFFRSKKANNYETQVTNLLSAFHILECNRSVKLPFLYSHLDRFPENLGAVSANQSKRFQPDLKTIEERYQGRWDQHMMTDYCLNIKRDCPETIHKIKSFTH